MAESYRYQKLGYLALNVTNLERSIAFYRDQAGLALTAQREGVAFLRCADDHHVLALYQASQPGIKRIAFQMESGAELDKARKVLGELGIAIDDISSTECAALRVGRGFRYRVPGSGLPFELYDKMETLSEPFVPTVATFDRLGHIVLQVKDWTSTLEWLTAKANFRTSDHVEGWFAFLRCFPNPYHHSVGIGRSETTHLHHFCFLVKQIDDIGRAINRFKKAGVPISFGPGRHVASTSVFLYFDDPDGMTLEYSFGMEHFDEHTPREPRMLVPSLDTVDEWGGVPAPGYASVGAIEGATV